VAIAFLGFLPAMIISSLIAFIYPAIVAVIALIYMLLARFNIKRLLCLLEFFLSSVLCYAIFAFELAGTGLDGFVNSMFWGSLFALIVLAFIISFFVFDKENKK